MRKTFKFVVELEVEYNEKVKDYIDDLVYNVAHGVGEYVMKGVIDNSLNWEFDNNHSVKKVISSPVTGNIHDEYGRNLKSPYRYEEDVRDKKIKSIFNG